MELPTEPRKAPSVNSKSFIIYGAPKIGKSAIIAGLTTQFAKGKSLILSTEPEGYDYLDANVLEVLNPGVFEQALVAIENDKTLEYIIVDPITSLDDWSEVVGTYMYMQKPQGKRFNVGLTHKDESFQTVHEIGEGHGYRYSREVMVSWVDRLKATGKTIILIAHIKDKLMALTPTDTILSYEIDLTGKLKTILPARVSSVAKLVVDGDNRYLSFETKENNSIMGSRPAHLTGKILISEKTDEGIITHWDKIFI